MRKDNRALKPYLYFTEEVPYTLLKPAELEPQYIKAFFSCDFIVDSDYSRNTTTWD